MLVVFVRTLILFALVVLVMRIMGKPQIGELEPFELVIAIMLSDLAAVPMADSEIPLSFGIIPILTLLLAQVSLSYGSMKSEKVRNIICGNPSILIAHGIIQEREMRRLRMNINELLEQLRVKSYPNIAEVDYAILETNGQLSIIPKGSHRPVTTQDMGIDTPDPGLPLPLVLDGRINQHNMELLNLTRDTLESLLKTHGISNLEEVFYAGIDDSGTVTWQKKEDL